MKKNHGPERITSIGCLRRPLLYTAAWAVLLAWGQSAAHWPCAVAFLFLVAVVTLITASLFEKARMRRRAWLGQYLHRASSWRQWLRGGWLMRLRAALLALGLATVLLTQSLDLNGWYWGLLLINAWWLHLAQHTLQKRLQTQVKTHFLAPLTRLVVVPLNVVVLTGAWVLVTLFTSQPDYRGLPFEAALYSAAKGVDASCGLVGLGQRLALSYRESIYSLMQNTVADYETGGLMAVAAWTLMLLLGSAFAWAYTQGIVALSRGHPSRDGLHP